MKESTYEREFMRRLHNYNKEILTTKGDSSLLQGIPDRAIYYGNQYALLEFKKSSRADKQVNQDFYVDLINSTGGFARFVSPENGDAVFKELVTHLGAPEKKRGKRNGIKSKTNNLFI